MMADEKTNLKEPKDDILKEARHRFEIACDAELIFAVNLAITPCSLALYS